MAPCGVDPLFFDLLVAMAMAMAMAAFYLKGVSPPRVGA